MGGSGGSPLAASGFLPTAFRRSSDGVTPDARGLPEEQGLNRPVARGAWNPGAWRLQLPEV